MGDSFELKDKPSLTFACVLLRGQVQQIRSIQNQAFSGCKERINTVVHTDLEETNPAKPTSQFPNQSQSCLQQLLC